MKILLLLLCSITLRADTIPLGVPITQGPITIQCAQVDWSGWPDIFRITAPKAFHCLISTITPNSAYFAVTLRTSGKNGMHTYTLDRTDVQRGFSVVVFTTEDPDLISVFVSETLTPLSFGAVVYSESSDFRGFDFLFFGKRLPRASIFADRAASAAFGAESAAVPAKF